ncbi:MAG: lantibiotic immunity ABC transporter MutE/EpiE family permease subunit [Velocimicrobium sp.]
MFNYIKAEHLKCKRSFAKKMVIIAPLVMLMLAIVSGRYFVENGYNWWYTMIFPGFITLITALLNQKEENKLHYRTVFALPVSLRKVWISKVLLIAGYVATASLIHLVGIIIGKYCYNSTSVITVSQMIVATLILVVVSLWQIPLCLFLSKKFGLMVTILINVGGGIVLDLCAASRSFWWVCSYSWGTRLMCPVLGILPNGLLAQHGDALLNPEVILLGIIISVIFFVLLLTVTANWFSRQEVK